MKLKVYIKYLSDGPIGKVVDIAKGDWIDLRSSLPILGHTYQFVYIPLGVAIELPPGFEAIIAPRSSTPERYGFIVPNSIGVVDNSYCGNLDEWKCPALFFKDGYIHVGDRICQFRIQLSQKATIWNKLRWFLSSGIELIEVKSLKAESRGGFGTTGRGDISCCPAN